MSSRNMASETVNPQALQLQRTNFDAADGWIDFPITDLSPADFNTTTLVNVDGAKTKSGLRESETIDWSFDLECMTAGRMDTGSLQLATMDFDVSYNPTIP